ncbi:MAG: hypothetical protein PHQ23_16215 [Candidatus Wallbacteria bacterium]|nr:hypothetical protein [Candidatus Wallbacteria bacterium]
MNSLIHREYANAFVAKMIIEKSRVVFENASIAHDSGPINPDNFVPHPKNPVIAKVFREIGLADELGSGVRNLYKYCRTYCGSDPQLIEGDVFRFILPMAEQSSPQVTRQATMQATMQDERTIKIIEFCKTPKTRDEIQNFLNLKNRDHFRSEVLNPLIESGLLHPTLPDKPTSPKQKYYSGHKREDS